MTEQGKQQVYEAYSAHNMKKLRQTIHKAVSGFGGLTQMDYDDFLSRANLALWQLVEAFDDSRGVPLEAYLRKHLPYKIMEEQTYRGREKRVPYVRDANGNKIKDKEGNYIEIVQVSMDASSEDGVDFSETLASDFSLEDAVEERMGLPSDERVDAFLKKLSKRQRDILLLHMQDYSVAEIKQRLELTDREYNNAMAQVRQSRYLSLFNKKKIRTGERSLD